MNKLIILSLLAIVVQAIAIDKLDKAKTTSSPVNAIQQNPKYEMVYQQVKYQQPTQQIQLQPVQQIQTLQQLSQFQKAQFVPVQIIQRPYYVSQQQSQQLHTQPHAMIIIAQPALVPQSLVYGGNPTQQLLNYFHSNPQAKYQLLQGNYQQATQQIQQQAQPQPTATYVHPVVASPVSNYILASPQHQIITQASPVAPTPVQYTHQPQYSVQQLQQIQQAQAQPQQQVHQVQAQQVHQAPAQQQVHQVQQAQEVQQVQPAQQHHSLSSIAHLAQLAAQQYASTPMKSTPAIVTGFEQFTPEQQAQIKAQLSSHLGRSYHAVANGNPAQYSAKYAQDQENQSFVPSPQVKNEAQAQNVELLKTRYLKKN